MIRDAVWTTLFLAACAVGVAAAGAVVVNGWLAIIARRASVLPVLILLATGCTAAHENVTPLLVQWGLNPVFVATLIGGLLGGLLRAWSTWNQATFGRRSLGDLLVGSLMGTLLPFMAAKLPFAPPELLSTMTPALWLIVAIAFGYTVASLVTNWITNYVVDKTKGMVPAPPATKEG